MKRKHITQDSLRFARRTGLWLYVPGMMALTALPFCFDESGKVLFFVFAGTAVVNLTLAGLFSCLRVNRDLDDRSAMASVAMGWLLVAIMCGLPLYLSAVMAQPDTEIYRAYRSPANAFFEGMSGITSCGLTLSSRPDQLPMVIQWWRSLSEWVGGLGVVMLMFLFLQPRSGEVAYYRAEARSWTLKEGLHKTILHIWVIYGGLTLLSILGLRTSGTSWWEAVNHGMTAISTGGFTIRSDSFASVSAVTRTMTILLMILGGISFRAYHLLLFQKKKPWTSPNQLKGYLVLLLTGGTLLVLLLRTPFGEGPDLLSVGFQWVSALGTCGFSNLDLSVWPAEALLLLVIAMSIGGAAGSTTGGLKISRLMILEGFFRHQIRKCVLGREKSKSRTFDRKEETEQADVRKETNHALVLLGLWISTLLAGWILLLALMPSQSPVHLLFEAASALGSVGLTSGVTTTDIPDTAKLLLALLMWLGRLEFFSVLMLVFRPCRICGKRKRF